ncbi:MAG: SirB2 family protein [Bacteroidota bacterium]
MYTGLLHTHKLSVILFLFIYLIKLTFLLLSQKENLTRFTKWIRIPEMIISFLFLITGIIMLFNLGRSSLWLYVKIGLVFLSIPIAVVGFRRLNKGLGILAVFLVVCVYGLAEMQKNMVIKGDIPTAITMDPSAPEYNELIHGEALFKANCTSCHGEDGKNNLSGAKDLTQSKLGDIDIKKLIRKGKNSMPSYERIYSDEEIDALTEYVKTYRVKE